MRRPRAPRLRTTVAASTIATAGRAATSVAVVVVVAAVVVVDAVDVSAGAVVVAEVAEAEATGALAAHSLHPNMLRLARLETRPASREPRKVTSRLFSRESLSRNIARNRPASPFPLHPTTQRELALPTSPRISR